MSRFDKVIRLLKKDGPRAVCYAVWMKLRERQKPQTKYDKWIQHFEYQLPVDKADKDSMKNIILIEADCHMLEAIKTEEGDYFAFYIKGDSMTKFWKEIVSAHISRHPEHEFIYTDEDFFANGKRRDPLLKPEWSPDTYLSYDYIGGLMVLSRKLALAAGEILSSHERVEERYGNGILYALGLCASELIATEQIGHLKRVLYHRESKYKIAKESLYDIKIDLIKRRSLNAELEFEPRSGELRLVYGILDNVKASIIIPSKNQSEVLRNCLLTAEKYAGFDNYEWIIVDNGSDLEEKLKYEALGQELKHHFEYVYSEMDFNFARMCNIGYEHASGECLVFLNDDIEFFEKSEGWLRRLIAHTMQPTVGAVGAKLLYPGGIYIQHIGVVNYARGAAHILNRSDDRYILPMFRNCLDMNVSIVTGALLGVERSKFEEVGAFCEELKVTYNDVDLCLKLLEHGYYNVLRSDVCAYHLESLARGEDMLNFEKYRRCIQERELLFEMHPNYIGVDSFYHPYLTQTDLNAGVSTVYLPAISKAKRIFGFMNYVDSNVITHRVDLVSLDEWLEIRAYAYMKHPGQEKVSVVLEGEKSYRFDTHKVFNHTYTEFFNDGRSYAFIGFVVLIRYDELPVDDYGISIKIGQSIVRTNRRIRIV